jgi:uncharacterized repeat protein (TIGR01451 family)
MPFTKYVVTNFKRLLVLLFIICLYNTNVIAVTYTYIPSSIVPASGVLPDNACPGSGVTVTFNVIDNFTVNDVDLGVNITHTYRGDLDMRLSSPATANINLLTDVGGGANNLNILFDSDSGNVVPGGAHALAPDFVNIAHPENTNALNNFDGENSLGNWVYFVCDDAGADLGTLTAAEIRFDGTPVVVVNEISGTIFRDLNYDGIQNGLELGEEGITVTAYDDSGFVISDVTDANGDYILSGLVAATNYRVEVNTPSYLYASTSIGVNNALVSVVTAPSTHNVGVQNTAQYCQANPDFIMSRFTKEERGGVNSAINTVLQYNYLDNGTDAPTNITNYGTIGSVYGISHLSKANVSYAGTYFKRHADIGSSGIGAIYKIDHNAANAVSTFATLPGNDPRGGAGGAYDWNHDTLGYANVAKTSIGDIELSDDENTLFAVNMDDRKLYVLGVDSNGDLSSTSSFNIPNPCSNVLDYRPMGLGYRDGSLYVGVTCTAESSVDANNADDSTNGPRKGDKSLLSAHVYSFNSLTSTFSAAAVLSIDLTYDRGCIYSNNISVQVPSTCTYDDQDAVTQPYRANWNPWQMDYAIVFNDKKPGNIGNQNDWIEYMQPILSDIEFDNNGSMVVAIRDVNGDRGGHQNHSPDPADVTLQNMNGEGDIIRACGNPTNGWTLESNASCGGITSGGAGNDEGIGGGEFYYYDNGPGGNGNINGGNAGHSETSMGGLLIVPGHADIITGVMDAHGTSGIDNGIMWLQNSGAQVGQISRDLAGTPKRLLVSFDAGSAFYGKGSGIGDIEALCDPEPLELGDYVWNDADNDGIQDPSEVGIPGVAIQLYDGASLVGTATTDASGFYVFGGATNTNMSGGNTLIASTTYQLRVNLGNVNLVGLTPTARDVNANADDLHDSDSDNGMLNAGFSTISYTTGSDGQTNHALDFGFTGVPIADLSLIKNVSNSFPVIGTQITFTITITNDGLSDATNFTVVDTVPSGYSGITSISGGGVLVGNVITWSNLSLTNGSNINLTFIVTVNAIGVFENLAEVTSSAEIDSDSTPNNGVDTDGDGNTDEDLGDEDDGDGETVSPVIAGTCVLGNNDVGGIVFRDFNQNGSQDSLEPGFGVVGMIVTAYNAANVIVATANVQPNGAYSFSGIAGVDYRLELSGLPSYLEHGVAGAQSQSSVRFINSANCSADFTVNNPVDYCQADPDFMVARFTKEERAGVNSGINTILQYNYLDNGTDAPTTIQTYNNLGAIYGLAHLRKANVTYGSTYFKTHSDIGPSGIGAIYKIDHNSGNAVSTFVNLPGTDPRGGAGGAYDWDRDSLAYASVGKTGIGDIELSDDESLLFAVNMEDRNLYIMGVDASGNITTNNNVAIPNPCNNALDYRPMGLGFNDGLLYVGVTCTAESTVDANNVDDSYFGPRKGIFTELSAHVYSFDPLTSLFNGIPVLDIALDYQRGCGFDGDISVNHPPNCATTNDKDGIARPFVANWNPWQLDFDIVFNDKNPGNIGNQDTFIEYQQPILSDIEFDNDGTIIVQIKDINGDRSGHGNLSPASPGDGQLHNGNSYGDLLRACGNATLGWVLESNGSCGGITTAGAGTNEGPGNGEYYYFDNGPGGNGNVNGSNAGHSETTMGGLLLVPGHIDLITGVMDPLNTVGIDTGLMWLQNTGVAAGQISMDGLAVPKRLQVSFDANGAAFFGKASGIGDIEALCDPAPIEVGNRIWNDTNGDGIQDADEPGIDGVTVTLSCGVDSVSAVTSNGGLYYFNNGNPVNIGTIQALFMDAAENCQISVNNNQGALAAFGLTLQDADANITNDSTTDVRDSDASISGSNSIINITTGAAGQNNHSYDFGFEPQAVLIDYGDAPDTGAGTGIGNYQTTVVDAGPSHVIINSLYMGAGVPDSEIDGQPNALATGDDIVGSSDEDGPQTILNFATGSTPAIQVLVTNQTGLAATLSGWIDYNGNGVFDTGTEGTTSAVLNGSMLSLVTLTFPVVPAGVPADTVLRLRLSTDAASLNATGAALNGEVEDHRVTLNQDLSGDSQLCYVVADGANRLVTTNPLNGSMDDTAAGLGNLPYSSLETIAWDLGDPLISGDETLYAPNTNQLVQLLPLPRTVIGTFNNGITDSDGFAIDWQSIPPLYYGSGNAGNGHLNIFNFNPANANVLNVSSDIVLPQANTQIDDIAWDPINRRLLGVTNNGTTLSHLVQFDLTNLTTTGVVNAVDCGPIIFAGAILQDTEGLTFSRPGELFITTGNGGPAATQGGLYRVAVNGISADCSAIIGVAPDIIPLRVGPVNTLTSIAGTDHEAIDCGLSFAESQASIGNRVWLDEDSDGDQDGGEDGIGGVTVYLCRANAAPCDAGSAIKVATTDANGGYLFTGLPILDYIVAVETNTVPTNLVSNPTYDEDSGTITPNHQTVVSLIQAEEEHLTADFGYNWNESPETETPPPGTVGSIGDRVWIDADSDGVQDANEAGINSVTVNLYTDPDGDSIFDTLIATTTTDENGNYNFDGLSSGAYVVEVNPITLPAGVSWTQTGDPDEFAQVATAADHRTTNPIILAPGDVFVNADFGYQGDAASTHLIGDTIYLDANANGSQNVGEPGIANVTVTLLDSASNPIAQAVTDENGQYLFSGLPDAIYSVVVADTNNVLASLVQSADPDVTLDNKSTVNLAGSDNLNQDFGYKPLRHTAGTGLIGDTIFMDINGNGSQSVTEPGIEGVVVELIDSSGFPVARTTTDENGNYQFGNLADETYTVRVDTMTLPNAGVGMSNTADPDGGTANESTGIVIAGGNVNLLQDFGYQVNIPNIIGGTLWNDNDADGTQDGVETVEFAGVTINLLDVNGNVVGTTVTDASGHYEFSGLPDGTYTILVTDDTNVLAGHWLTDGTNPGSDLNSQVVGYSVSVAGGSNNQTGDFGYYVNLASIGNIVYRDDNNDGLRNSATEPGIPLVPVTLTITYPNNDTVTLTTLTDGAGFYSFEKLLADDSYQKAGIPGNGIEPSYSITVGAVATGFTSTYDGTPDAAGFGSGTNDNSDNTNGEIAYPVKGAQELTNDFGFVPGATIGNRVWLDLDNDGIQDANEDGIANRVVQLTPPAAIDIGAGAGNPITTVTDTNGNYIFTELPLANGYIVTVTNPPAGLNQTFDEDGTGTAHTSVVNLTSANEEHLTADFGYITPDGTIGDYIWSDANGDGQQDPNEVGLANIDVYLCNTSANPCDATTPVINVIAMTTTDATGHYLFSGVSLVDVHNVGVDTTTLPAGYVQTGDPDGVGAPDNQTTVLALTTTNNINLDADFGYQPPAVAHSDIGDTIYQDLDGNGAQGVGESGVPGVTVQLFVDTTADGTPDTPIASEVTDASGNYLFPSLPNGVAYSIVVTDTNNILNNFEQTADPDAVLDNQSIIPVLIMDRLDQDFGYRPLRKGNGIIGDRIFHDVNSNAIQDAGDQGLEGVAVRIFDSIGNLIDAVFTDENGQYLFTGLDPSGTYTVIVETSSLPNGGVGWNNNIDPDGTLDAQTVVNLSLVPSGIDLDQDFGFIGAQSNTIEGTVWSDNDGNGLLTDGTGAGPDETPNGLENVTVELKDSDGNIVATTTTDANGDYSFTGLPDATYTVSVTDKFNELANLSHTDGPNAGDNSIDNNSQDDTGYDVSVAGGNTNSTADFGYQPVVTTPITLASFIASYNQNTGETTINWSTLTETGNLGFDLYLKIDGVWKQANKQLIVSKDMYSTDLTKYQFIYNADYSTQWALVDVDIKGKRQSHGTYELNKSYGKETSLNSTTDTKINWQHFNQLHNEKESLRNTEKSNAINAYIRDKIESAKQSTGEGS